MSENSAEAPDEVDDGSGAARPTRAGWTAESSLTTIANEYGTDKGTLGPNDRWHCHNYTDIYEAYLWPRRHQPIRLLEVGLGVDGPASKVYMVHGRNQAGGASIKMWSDYLPAARIYGIDINPAAHLDNERVTTFVADQGDPASLRRAADAAGGHFDVIIDDGSHRADHQQITFGTLFDYLEPDGFYFIEDLMANGVGESGGGPRFSSPVPVLGTRRLFRTFADTGLFEDPHCIGDADRHAGQIEWVHFHSPESYATLWRWKGEDWPIPRFYVGCEELCIIRKRGSTAPQAEKRPAWWKRLGSRRAGSQTA